MAHDPNANPEDGPKGPPWINPEVQHKMQWRDGDIVISVPGKSGTTWTMNIVHQLRSGGDPDLEDVYVEVPWAEFIWSPQTTVDDVVAKLDSMPTDVRRAFKSHSPPPMLPYHAPGSGKEVKYIVVVRNPEEALVSMHPFMGAHTQAWFDAWQMPREAVVKPNFEAFYNEVGLQMGFQDMIFGFVANWWPHRHAKNVLMIHFHDMKKDREAMIRRIADFLGYSPTKEQWKNILEYTSFAWMKAHQDKFEARKASNPPVLESGAMVRKGKVGAAAEDGMTDAIAAQIRERAGQVLQDGRAIEWLYGGGPL
jgi:hypothetical protein